jgi:lysophospholipase L1-like esterase
LGTDYQIIEEGLPGRTTAFDDVFESNRSGAAILPMILESHTPLDLLIIILGTNDLQAHRKCTARETARGVGVCIESAQKSAAGPDRQPPKILVVCPPPFKQPKNFMNTAFGDAVAESEKMSTHFALTCDFFSVPCIMAGDIVESCEEDGIHLTADAHRTLGQYFANYITKKIELG